MVGEYTLYNFSFLKFVEVCFMPCILVNEYYMALGKNVYCTVGGWYVL